MKRDHIPLLNQPMDVSEDFLKMENHYFLATHLSEFDKATGKGLLHCKRHGRKVRNCFNQISMPFEETQGWEFPPEYSQDMDLPLSISFVSARTIRLRLAAGSQVPAQRQSLMLMHELKEQPAWNCTETEDFSEFQSEHGSVTVRHNPFAIEFRDAAGVLLTKTLTMADSKNLENMMPFPFSAVRRAVDHKRRIAASFSSSPSERIYGCGESFTSLNKKGQKVVLSVADAFGVQTEDMYKPIPFFMSNKGYGMFVHTSTPVTFDFGHSYDGANLIYLGDEQLDLFVFLGNPQEILTEYTSLTGKSPMPPLWSFGLWMSRISYYSEEETRAVAGKLREERIPCDVIHIDTGWFETEWRCNYRFSESRFADPARMIEDLHRMGFRISLWQLPYFTPMNELYQEAVDKDYVVLDPDGGLPTEDAIIDFSNDEAVAWYQSLLASLFDMGVDAIKADFGEAAPSHGRYKSGVSGLYEHNLYPLRYNKAVADITKAKTGHSLIWARSAWAGSQRYPIHWGGDAENTDCGMAATLRGGLSLGLCGFSFWSHDIGGFVHKSPEELYRRWLPFGMLTSHSRCHGAPPKEPWEYGAAFTDDFRNAVELKYGLMPYIYTQARISAEQGFPMMRTLFFEYPEDQTAWFIEDEYLFGERLLVAPMFQEGITKRNVYLPAGIWVDYQTHKQYEGEKWHAIEAGDLPVVILVKAGTLLPHLKVAQCTNDMNWNEIELRAYLGGLSYADCTVGLPDDGGMGEIRLQMEGEQASLSMSPSLNHVVWSTSIQ